ncbi:hypothetical protein Pla110_29250 [Polystyrenella longa]|uniref:Tyr recombinase domain-containing protein n=1 Tax=Polystyrenella longa TaxID=2528007 RepID=A0A518CPM9_9PLAN|nr:hypothetical protein Pla110_29250 [Polystyrenella longa]
MTSPHAGKLISKMGKAAQVILSRKEGKIKFASAHDFRRAFGTRWSTRVMPPVLQQLMRHESIDTTLRYYVEQEAEATAEILYSVVEGNYLGNTSPNVTKKETSSPS